ncbi:AT02057p [Strongyloides ratti]|uniref:AT02057p n=1 Tax=Strongyloides ratti TaxID=34506 RepID=A0A090KXA5_STRRB|nr:AT02057p [Strongyloides ratti]CEF59882.1 AT02057p [Strongyloides ratti]
MIISHLKPQFTDRFWSEKNEGYLNLYESLVRNEETVHKFLSYVREVLNFEDLSIKNLEKLINRSSDLSNCGSNFDATFSLIKACNAAKKESKANLIEGLSSLVKEITDHLCEVSKNRKAIKELNVSNIFKEMSIAKHDLEKAEDLYKSRYEDLLTFNKTNGTAKECNKLENKVKKANDEYKNSVEKYNKLREEYENKMIFVVERVSQYLETHYIKMKNFISKLANNYSSSATLDSISTSDLEDSLKGIDIIAMLNNFVAERSTGGIKPEKYVIQENILSHDSLEMPPLLPLSNSLASSTNSSAKIPPLSNDITNQSNIPDLLTLDLPVHVDNNLTEKCGGLESVKEKTYDSTSISGFSDNGLSNLNSTHDLYKNIQSQNTVLSSNLVKKNPNMSFNHSIDNLPPENSDSAKNSTITNIESTTNIQPADNIPSGNTLLSNNKLSQQNDYEVDSEGYTIRKESTNENFCESENFDSDSSDDGDFGRTKHVFKKLYIKSKDESVPRISHEKSLEAIKESMGNINKSWLHLSKIPTSESISPTLNQNPSTSTFSQSFTSPSLQHSYAKKEMKTTLSFECEKFLKDSFTSLNSSTNNLTTFNNSNSTKLNPIARPRPRPMSTTNIFSSNYNISSPAISETVISENESNFSEKNISDNTSPLEITVDNIKNVFDDKYPSNTYSFNYNFNNDQESYHHKTYSNSLNSDFSTPSEKGSSLVLFDTLSKKECLRKTSSVDNSYLFKPHFSVVETVHVQGKPDNNFSEHKMCIYGVVWMSVRNELFNKINNPEIFNLFTDINLILETKKIIKNWKMNEKVLVSVIKDTTDNSNYNVKIGKIKLKNWLEECHLKNPKQPFYCIEILRYELTPDNIVPPFIISPRRKITNTELLFYMKWLVNPNHQNDLRVVNVKKFTAKLLFSDIKDIKIKSIDPFGAIHAVENEIAWDEQAFKTSYIREGEFKAIILTNGNPLNSLRASISFEISGSCFSSMNIRIDKNDNAYKVAEIRHTIKSGKYYSSWLGELS